VFLRPAIVVTLDELEAPQPAEFRWLLHAFDEMKMDEGRREVVCHRGGASLTARLDCQAGLAFSQTDKFDTPFNEGNPPEYHQERADQWHFTARTKEKAARARVAAAMVVRGPGEAFETEWLSRPGRSGVRFASEEGKGEVWIDLAPGAAGLIEAVWTPKEGDPERLSV
jgi:hypothetical protein